MKLQSDGTFFNLTSWLYEIIKGVILTLVIIAVTSAVLITIYAVDGDSMEPNFQDGQYILVGKLSYLNKTPRRGEVVILRFPGDPDKKKYIKRIIGLPEELLEIKSGKVFINNQELPESYLPAAMATKPDRQVKIPPNEFYLIGDNRLNSSDSRSWGTCSKEYLIGQAWLILLPFKDYSTILPVEY